MRSSPLTRAATLLFRTLTGVLSAWLLNGSGGVTGLQDLTWTCGGSCASAWRVVGAGRFFSDDATTDVLWYNDGTTELSVWRLDGRGGVLGARSLPSCGGQTCVNEKPVGVTDLTADGYDDVVFHGSLSGQVFLWNINAQGRIANTIRVERGCDHTCADLGPIGLGAIA